MRWFSWRRPTRRPRLMLADARIAQLERRLEHLEAALEGLQDSVHREATRHEQQLSELQRATQPGAIAQSLSADARKRGI